MKRNIIFVFLTVSAVLLAGELKFNGIAEKVTDGDTFTAVSEDKKIFKVRLDKIDAPEIKQDGGEDARNYLSKMILGKKIAVFYNKTDIYGRILGEVYCEGYNINLKMVKDGYAWHYKKYDKSKQYKEAELSARKNKLGIWAKPDPVEPEKFRKNKKKTE